MRFSERAKYAKTLMGKKLFCLMEEKKSNLFVSLDVTETKKVLEIADQLGPLIAGVKTHVDILKDFTPDFTQELEKLSHKHQFIIFEDRKFADIGNTVKHQYSGGLYKIADWAHITNAHTVPGPGVIEGLKEVGLEKNRALLLLAEMSPEKTLAKGPYTQSSIDFAKEHKDFVMGFISLGKLTDDPGFIYMTPGVQLGKGSDNLGQTYRTPEFVIGEKKSDIIIVGRDIIKAENPVETTKRYRKNAWEAYEKRTQCHCPEL